MSRAMPVGQWNKGKQEEFGNRRKYGISEVNHGSKQTA